MAMSSIKLLHTIGGALFIFILSTQIQIGNASPFNISSLSVRTPPDQGLPNIRLQVGYNGCEGYEDRINNGIVDLALMLRVARHRLTRLETLIRSQPDEDTEMKGIDRSTLYTFEAAYGTAYYSRGDKKNQKGLDQVARVKTMIERVLENLPKRSGRRMEIWCNDNFLTKNAPEGVHLPGPDIYWDSRPAERGGQTRAQVNERAKCRPNFSIASIVTIEGTEHGSLDLLTLCPYKIERMFADNEFTQRITHMRGHEFSEEYTPIDFVSQNLVLTLAHEFSHSKILLPGMSTIDVRVEEDRAYGWQNVARYGAQSPEDAIQNADNFAYFVTTMFLHKYHWGLGYSLPMFGTSSGVRIIDAEEDDDDDDDISLDDDDFDSDDFI